MKKFCSSFKEHATNVINFKKKRGRKILQLTTTTTKKKAKITPRRNNMIINNNMIMIIEKLETIAVLHVNIEVQDIVYVI